MVGIAIWLRISYSGFVSLLPQHELLSLDSVGLIIGAVLFLVAFCGLIGAWFMSPCLLISVSIFICCVLCCLLAELYHILFFSTSY